MKLFKQATYSAIAALSLAGLAGTALAGGSLPGTGWWTGEQIQNISSASGDIFITAYDAAGATYDNKAKGLGTAAGGAVTFLPTDFSTMPAGFQGSAVVQSSVAIKAIVNVTTQKTTLPGGVGVGVDGGKAAAQYQGMDAGATEIYFPLVKNSRFGSTTIFYIQNAGSAAGTATAVFSMDDGNVYTFTTPSIGVGQMVAVVPNDAGVPTTNDSTRKNVGSLKVTSAQPLAGSVLEYRDADTTTPIALKGTRAFSANDFDTTAYAPVAKNNRFGRFTGIQVQNVSAGPVDITITYLGSANVTGCKGVTFTDTATGVAAGKSKTFVTTTAAGSQLLDNCTASAKITATGNIVAIVNEDNTATNPNIAGSTYSAAAGKLATTKISAPLFKDSRFAFSTGLQIQNVGSASATNVVATFACKGNNGTNTPFTAISNPQTITPGGAFLFIKPSTNAAMATTFTTANPWVAGGANCGVSITSDQPIVAIANESPDTAGALDDNNYEGFNLVP